MTTVFIVGSTLAAAVILVVGILGSVAHGTEGNKWAAAALAAGGVVGFCIVIAFVIVTAENEDRERRAACEAAGGTEVMVSRYEFACVDVGKVG